MKSVLILFFIGMTVLTLFGYLPASKFYFAGVSVDYMMDIIDANIISTLLLLLVGLLGYNYLRKPQKVKLFLLYIGMLGWFLSGRIVATIIYPDGRVSCGWFYIETERFYLCNATTDCETTISYKTKVEPLPFGRIRITNEFIDKTIFVNPFAWKATLKMFNNKFPDQY